MRPALFEVQPLRAPTLPTRRPSLAEAVCSCRPSNEVGSRRRVGKNRSRVASNTAAIGDCGNAATELAAPGRSRRRGESMGYHVVRYGLLGVVGQFTSAESLRYPRHSRVVVRSPRGLEVGEVLAEPGDAAAAIAAQGQILRRMSVEDDLLQARLESRRGEAFAACQQLLAEQGVAAALIDVEHLFDGEGLFFYFLGEPPSEAVELTQALAQQYESTVQFRAFAETLSEGCGPGCGTEEAAGQGGCSSCTSCAVASACHSAHK